MSAQIRASSLASSAADVGADLAGLRELAADHRQLARGVDEVAGAHGGHVGGQRRDDGGQFDAQLGEPRRRRSLRPLHVRDELLAGGPGNHRDQLPAVLAPLVEDLLGRVRQQGTVTYSHRVGSLMGLSLSVAVRPHG